MTKETRKLFRWMLQHDHTWIGSNSVYTLTFITIHNANLRISVEANGAFEILRTWGVNGQVMDHSTGTSDRVSGLKAHQDKQDRELVKKLWVHAKKIATEQYIKEIEQITRSY